MVALTVMTLEGGVTLSDTLYQQHGSPPLPSGGGGVRQTLRGISTVGLRPPTLPWYAEPGRRGVCPPVGGGSHRAVANTGGGYGRGGAGRYCGGGNYINQDNVEAVEDFWQRQRLHKAEEVKSILEWLDPHMRYFKNLSVSPSRT